MENDGQQQQAVEVDVRCKTWGAIAPWGMTTAETVRRPTFEAGLRFAAELVAKHCGGCIIAVREGDFLEGRIIESVPGTKPGEWEDCDDAGEGSVLERMIARHEDREKIHARIVWAEGHGLIGDADTERLLSAALRHGVPLTEGDFPPRTWPAARPRNNRW